MATIITRAGKGSPLENDEVDANFTNLDDDKLESDDLIAADTSYDNTDSGLVASNVQSAVDELQDKKLNVADMASNVLFYATTTASDIATYSKLVTSPDDADFDDTAVDVSTGAITTTDQFLAALASVAGVLSGATGIINISTIGNIRKSSGSGTADFHFEVYKRDSGGTETLMGTSSASNGVSASSYEEFNATALISSTSFTATDRVVIKFYGTKLGGGSNPVYDFQFGGDNPVRTNFPVPVNVVSHANNAEDIIVDTANFAGILSGSDDNVQTALDTIDDHTHALTQFGITATTTELNYTDGVTSNIQTQLNAKASLSGAAFTGAITTTSTFDGRDVATDGAKLDGIEASADVTDATNVTAAGALMDSEVTNLAEVKAFDSTDYATAAQGAKADAALPKTGGAMTGAITTNSTFDGRDVATDGTKLDGIETGATADQTASEILTAVKTVDGAASGLDADLLDGQHGSYYTGYTDTAIANLVDSAPATLDTLNELAAALGDDPNFATTVTNSIATKLPSSSYTAADVLTKIKTVDGAGSGLDADLLDGLTSGAFLRSNAADTKTGYLEMQDGSSNYIALGTSSDFRMWHDGTDTIFRNYNHPAGDMIWQTEGTGGVVHTAMVIKGDTATPKVELYFDSAKKLETTTTGVDITGTATATTFSGALSGNATTATNLANIVTTFNGTYPMTVNVSGVIYSHPSVTFTGATGTLTATTFSGALSGNATTATNITGYSGTYWTSNNDGTGSGLDADLLDGQEGSYYYQASNPSGYTTNVGDITGVTAGVGLSGGGASGAVTLTVDLSELTDMTAAMVGTDQFIVLDNSADRRKAANEIGLSIFSNDAGFTTYSANQALDTTSSPSFAGVNINGNLNAVDNIYLAGSLYHEGDTDTRLLFGTNTATIQVGGSSEITVNTTGVRLGDSGNGYFQPVTGSYGSVQIDGGAHGAYEGYSIGGRVVFMHNNGSTSGIYNDVNNEWLIQFVNGGATTLYYDGAGKLSTTSTGVDVAGAVQSDSLANGSGVTKINYDSSTYFSGAFSDTVNALGNTGTAKTINCSLGNVVTATLTGNCTFTISTPNSTSNRATSFTLVLTNDATASRTVAFAGGTFKYPGGSVSRTTGANATDIWFFFSPDNGTTWYVTLPAKNLTT